MAGRSLVPRRTAVRFHSSATALPATSSYAVGQTLHGYRVVRVADVPEKSLRCIILQHEASGAKHLHVEAQDSNNVFCVTFVTVPQDDTGVAHILEHTVL